MSNVQIPNLTPAIALNGSEQLEAVQNGSSVRITTAQIALIGTPVVGFPFGVSIGGTGANTFTAGYLKADGVNPFTTVATIPSGDISGLGTMAAQNANSVAITGGSISGVALTLDSLDSTPIGAVTPSTGVFTTVTVPTVYGGTGTGSSLTLQSSSTGGATDYITFKVGSAGATTALTIDTTGSLTFSAISQRFLADFTNATVPNRFAFQTSSTNSSTGIYALPAGTSTAASWQAANNSDPTNASKILIATNGTTDVQLVSGINGTGTYLPLTFLTNGLGRFTINTAGSWGIGPTATASYGTSGQAFISGGNAAQPTWGTLSVGGGGTGATTFTANGILYGNTTSAVQSTAAGTTGQVLVGNTGAAPSWSNATSVSVTSLSFGTTGFTPSTATQGAITVAGTLVAANGGTGQSSYTIGDLLYASGTTALSKLADVATGSVLVSGGVGVAPAWSASPTLTTSLTTPIHYGGTAANSTLTLQSTSGAGTTDQILFKVGSAGAVTALTIGTTGASTFLQTVTTTVGNLAVSNTTVGNTTATITSSNASALTVGLNGATNPAFLVDASTASSATGVSIKSAAAAGGVAIAAISSGTNENITINAKGSGTITLAGTSTGSIIAGQVLSGGTAASSVLNIQSTTGVGTTDAVITKTGSQRENMRVDASGIVYTYQPTGLTLNGTNNLTAAQLQNRIIYQTSGAAATYNLPTGTAIDTQLAATGPALVTNMSFDVVFIATSNSITVVTNTGLTTVGSLTVASGTSGTYRFQRTGTNTYNVYRVS